MHIFQSEKSKGPLKKRVRNGGPKNHRFPAVRALFVNGSDMLRFLSREMLEIKLLIKPGVDKTVHGFIALKVYFGKKTIKPINGYIILIKIDGFYFFAF